MEGNLFAVIAVPLAVEGSFHYSVPPDLREKIRVGMRVVVPFGAKRFYTGIVLSLTDNFIIKGDKNLKSIMSLPDDSPIVGVRDIAFWNWMSTYYMCTIGEVLRAALPSSLLPESKTEVIYNEEFEETVPLGKLEMEILSILTSCKNKSSSLQNLQKTLMRPAVPAFTRLISYGAIRLKEEFGGGIRKLPKERIVRIDQRYTEFESDFTNLLDSLKRAGKQTALLMKLAEMLFMEEKNLSEPVRVEDLVEKDASMRTAMNTLIKKGILIEEHRTPKPEIEETNENSPLPPLRSDYDLPEFSSLSSILYRQDVDEKESILLDLVHRELCRNKQVLIITPEVNRPFSNNDLIGKLKKRFGSYVRIYNSRLSEGKKLALWQELILTDSPMVVVGARSAIFLPINNPGLIVVDQDQDYGMKQQDPAPRYHARDAAICLAQTKGAFALIASETPSAETLYNLNNEKWQSIVPHIAEKIEMPIIETIDLDKLYKQKRLKMNNLVSPQLEEEIQNALDRKERILLIQNRRGYSPYIKCSACNTRITCPHCSVSLTYHKATNLMMCHYCGYVMSLPDICPKCHNSEHTLHPHDFGAERVEEEIVKLFPKAKVLRIDADVLQSKKRMEEIMFRIDMGEVDILVGTQVIAGMPIWDNISVIAVMRLDNILAYPDFRAHERAYQLLYQLALRSKRQNSQDEHSIKTKLLLQTRDPEHPFIEDLKQGDYDEFILGQLEERELCRFPPYKRMTTIVIKCTDKIIAHRTAEIMTSMLRSLMPEVMVDLRIPSIERIEMKFIREIVVRRSQNQYGLERAAYKRVINELPVRYPEAKKCRIVFDIDPL